MIWHEWQGRSVDEIAAEHGLELAGIYAALAYYDEHQSRIDRSMICHLLDPAEMLNHVEFL